MGSVSKTREVLSISPPGTCGPITSGRARSPFWLDSPQICLTLTGPAEELGGHLPMGQDRERGDLLPWKEGMQSLAAPSQDLQDVSDLERILSCSEMHWGLLQWLLSLSGMHR